jgi:hypothetical protein
MATIPTSFDAYTALATPYQTFQVDLLIAEPADETLVGAGSYSFPSDTAYAPVQVNGTIMEVDANYVNVELEAAEFTGTNYAANQAITGYLVSLVYSNGNVALAQFDFAQPISLGPTTDGMTFEPVLESWGFGDIAFTA